MRRTPIEAPERLSDEGPQMTHKGKAIWAMRRLSREAHRGLFCNTAFARRDLIRLDEFLRDDYIQTTPMLPEGEAGY